MAPDTSFDRLHFSVQQVFAEIRIVWQLVDIWLPAPLDFGQFQRVGFLPVSYTHLDVYKRQELGTESIVLLSTHIVSDIEHIADTVLMMKAGQIVFNGSARCV